MQQYNKKTQFIRNDTNNNNNNVPIRTLYVAPIKSYIVSKIEGYFQGFGEVESVRIHSKENFQYGFVQFKNAECAKTVLTKGFHRIANCNVKVRAGDLWHQPDFEREPTNPLLIPPNHESESHILNALNDDCLREVFGYFDLIDLSNAAEVCIRFNQQAKDAFAKNHKNLNLTFVSIGKKINKNVAENILRNFGAEVRSVDVDYLALESNIPFLRMLSKYCTAALKELKLSSFHLQGNLKKHRPLFSQLEKLRMDYCELTSDRVKDLFSYCSELKTISFENCEGGGSCIRQCFVKLEEAHLIGCHEFAEDDINSFISENSTLKKLFIAENGILGAPVSLGLIGNHLSNLIELEFNEIVADEYDFVEECQHLEQLKLLKVLKLDFNMQLATSLISGLAKNKVPIEHLKLTNGEINKEAINCITQLKQIKILELDELYGELTDGNLIEFARELPNLEELHVNNPPSDLSTIGLKKMLLHAKKLSLLKLESIETIMIDMDDYKAMLNTIQNRPEEIKLLIEITSSGDKVSVPDETLATNREIFYIDENIEESSSVSNYSDESEDAWLNGWRSDLDDDDDYMYYDSDADSENGYSFGIIDGNVFYVG